MAPLLCDFLRPGGLSRFLLTAFILCSSLMQPILCSLADENSYHTKPESWTASDGSGVATHATRVARAVAVTPNNSSVAGFTYAGCYSDADSSNIGLLSTTLQSLLNGPSYTSAIGMTWATCASYCTGYQYAGIKAGSICRCGNSFAISPNLNADVLCQTPCTGNPFQSCGANNRSTVFRSSSYGSTPAVSSAVPVLALPTTSSATRAATSSSFVSTLPAFGILQIPSVSQIVPVAANSVSSAAAPPVVLASSVPPAVPVLALTLIGAPLAYFSPSSTSSSVPLPPTTLVGAPLGFPVPSLLATTSGQPSAATLVGSALAFATTALLEPNLGKISTIQPLVSSLAPILSLLAPASSKIVSVQTPASATIVLPSQEVVVPLQGLFSQIALPSVSPPTLPLQSSLRLPSTSTGLIPSLPPAVITSQTLPAPVIPLAPLLSAVIPPIPTSLQTPSLLVPALLSVPSSPVALVVPPPSLGPLLPTTLATLISLPSLAVLPSYLPLPQVPSVQSPSTAPTAVVPTTAPTVAAIPLPILPPLVPAVSIQTLPLASPVLPTQVLADLPVATAVDEPFQILDFLGGATAAPPVGIPSLATILPSVKPAPVISIQTSALPPIALPSLAAILPSANPASVIPILPSLTLQPVGQDLVLTSPLLLPPVAAPTPNAPALELPSLGPPFETGTPWWVVTQFLEPHGLNTVPTILAPPPPLPTLQPPPSIDEPQNAFGALSFDEPTVPNVASIINAIPTQSLIPAVADEPQNAFGALSFDEPSVPNVASIINAIPTQSLTPAIASDVASVFDPASVDFTGSAVIESGVVIDKVFNWAFYSTGLVQVDSNLLSPFTGPLQGVLPDGTRIGLDSAGLYIGSGQRVPYPEEYTSIIAGTTLPLPQ